VGRGFGRLWGVIGVGWDVQERNFGSVVRAVESVGIVVRCDFISFVCRYRAGFPDSNTPKGGSMLYTGFDKQKSITSIKLNLPSASLQIFKMPVFRSC
jgi:hypothetical protein